MIEGQGTQIFIHVHTRTHTHTHTHKERERDRQTEREMTGRREADIHTHAQVRAETPCVFSRSVCPATGAWIDLSPYLDRSPTLIFDTTPFDRVVEMVCLRVRVCETRRGENPAHTNTDLLAHARTTGAGAWPSLPVGHV